MTVCLSEAADATHFVFQTTRLQIRPLNLEDQQLYLDLYSDPSIMRFVRPALSTRDAVDSFLSAVKLNHKKPFNRLFLAILEQGEAAGICAINQCFAKDNSVELGLMLKKPWHAKGYAVESFSALVQRVELYFCGAKIWVDIDPANIAAVNVGLKTGFRHDEDNPRVLRYG